MITLNQRKKVSLHARSACDEASLLCIYSIKFMWLLTTKIVKSVMKPSAGTKKKKGKKKKSLSGYFYYRPKKVNCIPLNSNIWEAHTVTCEAHTVTCKSKFF